MISNHPLYIPSKRLLRLALPIIAGQVGQVLMWFFDTVQIGGLGHEYIAASGFANGLYWMSILLGIGIMFAVSPLVSEALGKNESYKSIGVLRAGLFVSLVISVFSSLAVWILADNIAIFRHPETDNILGAKFLHRINYSTSCVFVFAAAKQFLDGLGKTKVGMFITLGGLVLNFLLNWLLIYGHWGMPAYGIEGSAMANGISRASMMFAILYYIWKDAEVKELRRDYAAHKDHFLNHLKPILVIGVPAGLQFFWEVAAFNAGQIMSGWISTTAEAAHMIAIGLASTTFTALSGVSAAGTILIGYGYGAKDKDAIRIAGKSVILITVFIEIFFAIAFLVGQSSLPLLYTDNKEVIALASSTLIFAAFFQISDGLQVTASGALRGMQDVMIPASLALFSYWAIMIPACYLLTFKCNMGLTGIWLGFVIGLTTAAVLQLLRYHYKLKSLSFTSSK